MTRTTRPLAAGALAVATAVWLIVNAIGTLRATVTRIDPDSLAPLFGPLLVSLAASVLLYAALVLAVHHAVPASRGLATGVLALHVVSLLPSLRGVLVLIALPVIAIQVAAVVALWLPARTGTVERPVGG
jgi:hypothetical protein